jgi:hypothetical protein
VLIKAPTDSIKAIIGQAEKDGHWSKNRLEQLRRTIAAPIKRGDRLNPAGEPPQSLNYLAAR